MMGSLRWRTACCAALAMLLAVGETAAAGWAVTAVVGVKAHQLTGSCPAAYFVLAASGMAGAVVAAVASAALIRLSAGRPARWLARAGTSIALLRLITAVTAGVLIQSTATGTNPGPLLGIAVADAGFGLALARSVTSWRHRHTVQQLLAGGP
ncbi:hypothetical protein ACQP2X_39455 [Actinoplanes sp. CA-131856]